MVYDLEKYHRLPVTDKIKNLTSDITIYFVTPKIKDPYLKILHQSHFAYTLFVHFSK